MSVEEMLKLIEEREDTMIKLVVFESCDKKFPRHIVVKKISSLGYPDEYHYVELWNNYNVVLSSKYIPFGDKEKLRKILENYTQSAEKENGNSVNFEFLPLENLMKIREFIKNIELFLLPWN